MTIDEIYDQLGAFKQFCLFCLSLFKNVYSIYLLHIINIILFFFFFIRISFEREKPLNDFLWQYVCN